MTRTSFLGDLLSTLLDRRASTIKPDENGDLAQMCRDLLAETGEVSALQLAAAILARFKDLDHQGQVAFFAFLTEELDVDANNIADLATTYAIDPTPDSFKQLMQEAEAPRQELLRKLNRVPGGTAALVAMRAALLDLMPNNSGFARTDFDFCHLLRSWFNRGFLVLRSIDWNSSAAVLEKIIAYEAVHAINDWDDLRRRLHPPDRRCFAFFHPAMPDEPLIFVEVALTAGVPGSVQALLSQARDGVAATDATTAVFYSISNCQKGLRGISFGNSLIKQVVAELGRELPGLDTYVTLSPLPGFNRWLGRQTDPRAAEVLQQSADPDLGRQLAAHYLLSAKDSAGYPLDPVARFHLSNGALVHEIHAGADLSENGVRQSSGLMVNYRYDPSRTASNHEDFVSAKTVHASKQVAALSKSVGLHQTPDPADAEVP